MHVVCRNSYKIAALSALTGCGLHAAASPDRSVVIAQLPCSFGQRLHRLSLLLTRYRPGFAIMLYAFAAIMRDRFSPVLSHGVILNSHFCGRATPFGCGAVTDESDPSRFDPRPPSAAGTGMAVIIKQTFALAWLSSTGPLPAASSTGESSALWFLDRGGRAQAWQGKHRLLLSSHSQPISSFAGAITSSSDLAKKAKQQGPRIETWNHGRVKVRYSRGRWWVGIGGGGNALL